LIKQLKTNRKEEKNLEEIINVLTEDEAKDIFQNEDEESYYSDDVLTDSVKMYLQEINKIPLLTAEEERKLGAQVLRGDTAARDKLVEHNLKLVVSIAKRYRGCGLGFLDLIQEGNAGLILAASKFDIAKGCRFSTYATWWIRQSISNALTNQSRPIRIPAHINVLVRKIRQASAQLTQTLGREPQTAEIADMLDIEEDKITSALEMTKTISSLDVPVDDDGETCLADCVGDNSNADPHIALMNEFNAQLLERVFNTLNAQESAVLRMRFGLVGDHAQTLEEVGENLGLSKERIRQVEIKALRKLRHPLRMALLHELQDAMA
jgi:RNA polymerase primary sigma factor